MKKNVMMRVASALLVAVLLTTCTISGTFAKYVTQDSGSDSARVAKWGVELQVVGNLYGDTYKDAQVLNNDGTLTVQASDAVSTEGSDVVAPGTANTDGFSISLKGTPEVDGQITATIITQNIFLAEGTYGVMVPVATDVVTKANFSEFDELYTLSGTTYTKADEWAEDTTYYTLEDKVSLDIAGLPAKYYPVVYELAGDTNYNAGTYTADSLDAIADLIATQLGYDKDDAAASLMTKDTADAVTTYAFKTSMAKTFDSNAVLDEVINLDSMKLTWAWAFENGTTDDEKNMYSGADTILANLQTGVTVVKSTGATTYTSNLIPNEDYCLDTMFSIDITVEQVD